MCSPKNYIMLVMKEIISRPIKGMPDDENKSNKEYEKFQLDMSIASRGTKLKIWMSAKHHDINERVYPFIFLCCSTKLRKMKDKGGMTIYQGLPMNMHLLQHVSDGRWG